jgi:hypothetical protein
MRAQLTRCFTDSAAALLAALATALSLGNRAGASTASPHEPIFALPLDVLFWISDAVTLVVLLGVLFLRRPGWKLVLIFWFAANLGSYRLAWQVYGAHPGGYLGALAHAFHLSIGGTNTLLNGVFLYLLTGSAALLLWGRLAAPQESAGKGVNP